MNDDLVYTVKEAAELLKTSQQYIRGLIEQGELQALKLGRLKIRKTSIESFLERLEANQ